MGLDEVTHCDLVELDFAGTSQGNVKGSDSRLVKQRAPSDEKFVLWKTEVDATLQGATAQCDAFPATGDGHGAFKSRNLSGCAIPHSHKVLIHMVFILS